ncbi:aldehyde dehydrogenase family protein [bacterium]|nr:aldehyde dehydrogenase family protein [bacterium]
MDFLKELGIQDVNPGACYGPDGWITGDDREELVSLNPATGQPIATIKQANEDDYEAVMAKATEAFKTFRTVPAPVRGDMIRDLGNALREKKTALGKLVSLEMGKIQAEGEGEVQEMIDICDFAVGLSRQLYGLTIKSERPQHRMMEQWQPLGVVGIITAFNFPVAVWAWNTALAAVCGDPVIWKPSSDAPLCAVAVQNIANDVAKKHGYSGVFNTVIGKGRTVGERLINDSRIPLVSFTGSTNMGKRVGRVVHERLGNTILELGGNNAVIVTPSANLDMAVRSVLFGAVGTSGQRCTSTRRVIVHKSVKEKFMSQLLNAYKQVTIGDPLKEGILMGPLVNQAGVEEMMEALETIKKKGGKILTGGSTIDKDGGYYVEPTIVEAEHDWEIVHNETFAPILYILTYEDFENEALAWHNEVPQGLSSAIFTNNVVEAETFVSPVGSDCGIANINLGTSGAEIGGAFGGEKETGGGRESGSDSWKAYMRRQTNTINYSHELPLAQGIKFGD